MPFQSFKSTVLKILLLELTSEYFRTTLSLVYRNSGLYWFRLSVDLVYFVVTLCRYSLVLSCICQCFEFTKALVLATSSSFLLNTSEIVT